jgi:hypothetical protein
MAIHVFVARQAFQKSPIHIEEFINAARQCHNLIIEKRVNRLNNINYFVYLNGNKRQRLSLTAYGLIVGQNPSRELIRLLKIARIPSDLLPFFEFLAA